jgi:hypothetical protein
MIDTIKTTPAASEPQTLALPVNPAPAHAPTMSGHTRGWLIAMVAVVAIGLGGLVAPAFAQKPAEISDSVAERARLERQQVEAACPRLKQTQYDILRTSAKTYNCIGWALGTSTDWVWPGTSVADFDHLTAAFGYHRIQTLDFRLDMGLKKIVLYGKWVDGKWEPTHMARQMPDGTWTSKLGKLPLIRHLRPSDLNGTSYGKPIAVYVRRNN